MPAPAGGDDVAADPVPPSPADLIAAAIDYQERRGWAPIPVNGKKPCDPDTGWDRAEWPTLRLTSAEIPGEFASPTVTGVGNILGEASKNLADIDLDCSEALAAADHFLPATRSIFGRPGAPRSHRLYVVDPPPSSTQFRDIARKNVAGDAEESERAAMLVEFRCEGSQTVFPPSLHLETGERIEWVEDGEPTPVNAAELHRGVTLVAVASLLAREWPREKGNRHHLALAVAGFLLRAHVAVEDVERVIRFAASWAADDDVGDRVKAVATTLKALHDGAEATGGPRIAEILGDAVLQRLTKWVTPHLFTLSGSGTGSLSVHEVQLQTDWFEPIPLDALAVPPFPTDQLPTVLRDMVCDVARVTQTPPDLAAVAGLVNIGAIGARRFDVAIGTSHKERINIFGAVVAESGTRKGPAQREMSEPLRTIEAELQRNAAAEIKRCTQRRVIAEKYVDRLSAEAARTEDPAERERKTAEAARLASELPAVPASPVLIVSDRTQEKLEMDLAGQGGALLLEDEEAGTLFATASGTRFGHGGVENTDVYCKSFDGTPLNTGRITRDDVRCLTPQLSINITPQPYLLRRCRDRPGLHHQGFLPRFLFAVPLSNVGERIYDRTAAFDAAIKAAYAALNRILLALPRHPDGAVLPCLQISGEALQVWEEYANRVERDMRDGGALRPIREWASKQPGRVARLAAILHFSSFTAPGVDLAIPSATVRAACRLGEYFEAHALAAYDCMAALPDIDGARRVLAWIRRTKQVRFSARDAFTALDRHFFRTMDTDLLPCLGRLVEYSYLRWVPPPPRSGSGRPSSPVYEANPKIFELLGKVRTPPPPAGNSADIAEESEGFPEPPETARGDFADIAEDVAPFRESKGADPEHGTGDFANTAEEFGGGHGRPAAAEAASEKSRDAPQYTQNPDEDVQPSSTPPFTHDRANAAEGGRVNAQALDGDALQAPQYPHNSVGEDDEAFTSAEGSNASASQADGLRSSRHPPHYPQNSTPRPDELDSEDDPGEPL
jgi:hypothetical protein